MHSKEQFIEMIDALVPVEIQESLQETISRLNPAEFGFIDLINLQEKARVLTIKKHISYTHTWHKAKVVDSSGCKSEVFLCLKCNSVASIFEHINTISIISKVKDELPTYTAHNEYLMYTCEEVADSDKSENDYRCFDCGVNNARKTNKCRMVSC